MLQLTLGKHPRSHALGHQTLSWLRWPQAGSRPDWDRASSAGGGSHNPPASWDCPCWTSVSCSLPSTQLANRMRGQEVTVMCLPVRRVAIALGRHLICHFIARLCFVLRGGLIIWFFQIKTEESDRVCQTQPVSPIKLCCDKTESWNGW